VKISLAAALLVLASPAGAMAETASAVFAFPQLKDHRGEVLVALYADRAAYEAREGALEARAPAAAREVRFDGLKPGRYAAMMFRDVNGDGKMNFAPLGIPLEPYAFSNNAPGRLGPAPWTKTVFEVKSGETRQSIRLP
jgi:uncharacterized protein (DUF2141 family)